MHRPFQDSCDEDLVRLAQAQDDDPTGREAAACLLQRHARKVYVWCRRYTQSDDEARDLAQDVFILAHTRLGTFSFRSRFTSWLFILTRHRCLTHLRRSSLPAYPEVDLDTLPSSNKDPEQLLLDQLGEDALLELISKTLDPVEQDAIWLRCI